MQNAEFQNAKLAQIYEDFNQFSEDQDFWYTIIKELGVKNIIDFGCGSGLFTMDLLSKGYSLVGIEPAGEMLEIANQKVNSSKVQWLHGSTEKLTGFQADLILMTSHVAQFLINETEWKDFLTQAYTALSVGGYLIFDSKNPLLKPWESYTREKTSTTKDTIFGQVNTQVEIKEINGNVITHSIYYNFLETGERFTSDNTLIYKKKEELEEELLKAGFEIVKIYGDWNGKEYFPECREMIFVAQKK